MSKKKKKKKIWVQLTLLDHCHTTLYHHGNLDWTTQLMKVALFKALSYWKQMLLSWIIFFSTFHINLHGFIMSVTHVMRTLSDTVLTFVVNSRNCCCFTSTIFYSIILLLLLYMVLYDIIWLKIKLHQVTVTSAQLIRANSVSLHVYNTQFHIMNRNVKTFYLGGCCSKQATRGKIDSTWGGMNEKNEHHRRRK